MPSLPNLKKIQPSVPVQNNQAGNNISSDIPSNKQDITSNENQKELDDSTSVNTGVKKLTCSQNYQPEGFLLEYQEMDFGNIDNMLKNIYINIIIDYAKIGIEATEEVRDELENFFNQNQIGYKVTVSKSDKLIDVRLTSDYETLKKYDPDPSLYLYQNIYDYKTSNGYYCS